MGTKKKSPKAKKKNPIVLVKESAGGLIKAVATPDVGSFVRRSRYVE